MLWYDTFLKKGTLRLYAAKEVGRLVPECNPFLPAHVFVMIQILNIACFSHLAVKWLITAWVVSNFSFSQLRFLGLTRSAKVPPDLPGKANWN